MQKLRVNSIPMGAETMRVPQGKVN
jgi:hypothetical protein